MQNSARVHITNTHDGISQSIWKTGVNLTIIASTVSCSKSMQFLFMGSQLKTEQS